MNTYRTELHVHTVLSPCAAVEMIPPLIINTAIEKGINLLAITDHNTSDNIAAVQKAAEGTGITVLPGMELQTREDIHSICLFDSLEQVYEFQSIVNNLLPDIKNDPDYFGEQFVVDATGDFIRHEERLLVTSANLSLSEAWEIVNQLQGILIPAHVDRTAFGLLPVLGFVPTDIPIEVLEITHHFNAKAARERFPQLEHYPLISNGDAHQLDSILGITSFNMHAPTITEIRLAIRGDGNRSMFLK